MDENLLPKDKKGPPQKKQSNLEFNIVEEDDLKATL